MRVGHQQFGLLSLLRASGGLERGLAPHGWRVAWTEFQSGLDLAEALRAGALDLGVTGEGPPVFAQAADAGIVYVGAEPPSPHSEAIIVPLTSSMASLADLRGARVAVTRGANAHVLLLRALEEAGLSAGDVEVVFAAPKEARLLFEGRQVDAWAIWDPWLAAVEQQLGARVLRDAEGLSSNRAYYVAGRAFALANRDLVDVFVSEVRSLGRTANESSDLVVRLLAGPAGIDPSALAVTLRRSQFGLQPFDDDLVASQQRVADSSLRHRLIHRPVSVAAAAWR